MLKNYRFRGSSCIMRRTNINCKHLTTLYAVNGSASVHLMLTCIRRIVHARASCTSRGRRRTDQRLTRHHIVFKYNNIKETIFFFFSSWTLRFMREALILLQRVSVVIYKHYLCVLESSIVVHVGLFLNVGLYIRGPTALNTNRLQRTELQF